jgi:hypothetical protein
MTKPRVKTEKEVRDEFLTKINETLKYWLEESKVKTTEDKMRGFAFSLLAMLDGGSGGICAFKVSPSFHPDDIEYHKKNGENWYPEDIDIAGCLHELWYKYKG